MQQGQRGGGWFKAMPWWLQAGVVIGTVVFAGMWGLVGLGAALAAVGIETEPAEEQVVVERSTSSTTDEVIRPTTTTTEAATTTSTTAAPPTTTTTADPFGDLSAEEQVALDSFFNPPPPPPPAPSGGGGCDPNYTGCVPISSDVDCAGGSGNGPAYTSGPVNVIGADVYDLDADGDGVGCE